MTEKNDPILQFVVDLRQACDSYIESVTPPEFKAIPETVFSRLAFEPHVGEKLKEYEIAQAKNNKQKEFDEAFAILKEANATINNRFHQDGYVFSYWLYSQAIFRQKLKQSV
jgi:hypothetical protein